MVHICLYLGLKKRWHGGECKESDLAFGSSHVNNARTQYCTVSSAARLLVVDMHISPEVEDMQLRWGCFTCLFLPLHLRLTISIELDYVYTFSPHRVHFQLRWVPFLLCQVFLEIMLQPVNNSIDANPLGLFSSTVGTWWWCLWC
jgi:hypothetical protein